MIPCSILRCTGLSPRVRGNLYPNRVYRNPHRSIPACTGEPNLNASKTNAGTVYPRVYGGTRALGYEIEQGEGLSPHVRGNQPGSNHNNLRYGSIPACTGEPATLLLLTAPHRVYPRVYGGTTYTSFTLTYFIGLSPRVRGNLSVVTVFITSFGSIPACTGEPSFGPAKPIPTRVYPRVYGGTFARDTRPRPGQGLSPRVRGNHFSAGISLIVRRSIPACTGEPFLHRGHRVSVTVYPRVYGGTGGVVRQRFGIGGLSPRVRGNLLTVLPRGLFERSIPACTGEPSIPVASLVVNEVYPRVYGGTDLRGYLTNLRYGLSPRVRGNHPDEGTDLVEEGSIPACTGEPAMILSKSVSLTVYPRVYGGTPSRRQLNRRLYGLSPRVRGNRAPILALPLPTRSIPACTGEPDSRKTRYILA